MVNIPPKKEMVKFSGRIFPCSHKSLFFFPRRLNWRHHHVDKVSLGLASITKFHQLTPHVGNSKGRFHFFELMSSEVFPFVYGGNTVQRTSFN